MTLVEQLTELKIHYTDPGNERYPRVEQLRTVKHRNGPKKAELVRQTGEKRNSGSCSLRMAGGNDYGEQEANLTTGLEERQAKRLQASLSSLEC